MASLNSDPMLLVWFPLLNIAVMVLRIPMKSYVMSSLRVNGFYRLLFVVHLFRWTRYTELKIQFAGAKGSMFLLPLHQVYHGFTPGVHEISCYIMLHHFTSCHIMSHHVAWLLGSLSILSLRGGFLDVSCTARDFGRAVTCHFFPQEAHLGMEEGKSWHGPGKHGGIRRHWQYWRHSTGPGPRCHFVFPQTVWSSKDVEHCNWPEHWWSIDGAFPKWQLVVWIQTPKFHVWHQSSCVFPANGILNIAAVGLHKGCTTLYGYLCHVLDKYWGTSPASALISLFQFPLKSLNQSFLWPLYLWNTEWPQVQHMLQWETKPTGTNEERSQQFKDRAALRRCKVGPDQLCSFCVAAELGRWAKHELRLWIVDLFWPFHAIPCRIPCRS